MVIHSKWKRVFLGSKAAYLQEGMEVFFKVFDGKPLSFNFFKPNITIRVKECNPFEKYAQDNPRSKPATLENGRKIKVPPYVNPGDMIIVDINSETFHMRSNDTSNTKFSQDDELDEDEEEIEEEEKESQDTKKK